MPREMTPTATESIEMSTRFLLDRKIGLRLWKIVPMMSRPMMTGSGPTSPARALRRKEPSAPRTPRV